MFDDVFFTPVDTMHLIDITHELLNLNQRGIINICGGERISKYEFSVKLAAKFGYDLILFSLFKPHAYKLSKTSSRSQFS